MLSRRLTSLREAIAMLEQGEPLKSDAAARLAMYRKNEERLAAEIRNLEHALVRREWLRPEGGAEGRSDLAADLLARLATADTKP